jgi:hypothetical protein
VLASGPSWSVLRSQTAAYLDLMRYIQPPLYRDVNANARSSQTWISNPKHEPVRIMYPSFDMMEH